MRGETAYTADVTSRMAASQTRVPRDICTPSHDFLKLRALIDNRATGRVGESLRNFGPDLELGSARYAERARPRVETPLSPQSIDRSEANSPFPSGFPSIAFPFPFIINDIIDINEQQYNS